MRIDRLPLHCDKISKNLPVVVLVDYFVCSVIYSRIKAFSWPRFLFMSQKFPSSTMHINNAWIQTESSSICVTFVIQLHRFTRFLVPYKLPCRRLGSYFDKSNNRLVRLSGKVHIIIESSFDVLRLFLRNFKLQWLWKSNNRIKRKTSARNELDKSLRHDFVQGKSSIALENRAPNASWVRVWHWEKFQASELLSLATMKSVSRFCKTNPSTSRTILSNLLMRSWNVLKWLCYIRHDFINFQRNLSFWKYNQNVCLYISVIDCLLSEWGPWSECDAKCGTGSRSRTRTVLRAPENGGKHCVSLTQKQGCEGFKCKSFHERKAMSGELPPLHHKKLHLEN